MTADPTDLECMAREVAAMGRHDIEKAVLNFQGRFQLDFTVEYLKKIPIEKLQHILLTARIQQKYGFVH